MNWRAKIAERSLALVFVATLSLAGCAGKPLPAPTPQSGTTCEAGDRWALKEVLYFGRNRPEGGVVNDSAWTAFVDAEITPRFPSGLTVTDGVGQWRGRSGLVERERSEVVTIYHDDTPQAHQAIGEIVVEYKRAFNQEAVLHEHGRVCITL